MRSFHPRFHDFFDLERGALLETDRVHEARAIETTLKQKFAPARDTAPLQVAARAGGRFEWFRGVHPAVMAELREMNTGLGHPLHAPLRNWLCDEWLQQVERVIDWIQYEFEQIETWNFNADPILVESRQRKFRNLLDAWESIGMRLDDRLPRRVRHWYKHGFDP